MQLTKSPKTWLVLFLLFWYFIWAYQIVSQFFVPAPHQIAFSIAHFFSLGEFWSDLGVSAYKVLVSFLSSFFFGVPLGLLIGMSSGAWRASEDLVDFFRSIPAIALYPVFALIFGISGMSQIATASFACTLIVATSSIYGVRSVDRSRRETLKVMGASQYEIAVNVIVWEAIPHILSGLRLSISYALILIVGTEIVAGSAYGMGGRLYDAQLGFKTSEMYGLIIVLGAIGMLLNRSFIIVENRLFPWIETGEGRDVTT